MTNRERLAYLMETYGSKIGNSYLMDIDSSVYFTFDNGMTGDVKHVDMDEDGDIYVIFHESDERFWVDDFSEQEVDMLLFVMGN